MYQGQVDVISNRETWISDFVQLTDEDGTVVNILNPDVGFDVSVYIKDESGCIRVTGTLANGKVIVSASDVANEPGFQWQFEVSDLSGLCPGTYLCGVKTTSNGEVKDLILGSLAVIEGN
jgi:hypothetical protein